MSTCDHRGQQTRPCEVCGKDVCQLCWATLYVLIGDYPEPTDDVVCQAHATIGGEKWDDDPDDF